MTAGLKENGTGSKHWAGVAKSHQKRCGMKAPTTVKIRTSDRGWLNVPYSRWLKNG